MIKVLKKILRPLKPILYPIYDRYFLEKPKKSFDEGNLIQAFFNRAKTRTPGVMIDVGAHFGESFGPYEKKGWKVLAFEPDPSNRERIKIKSDKTKLYDFAVSNQSGLELEFFTSDESSGISGLVAFHDTHTSKFKVKTITLTEIVEEEQVSNVDFLKIDTEGNDLLVLKGFPFDKMKPQVILCEFEDKKTQHLDYTYNDMGDYLMSKGYKVFISEWYPIERYGVKHKWHSIKPYDSNSKLNDPSGWGNFIGVAPEMSKKFNLAWKKYMKTVEE